MIGFKVPPDMMLESIRAKPGKASSPDLSQPSMASWLGGPPAGAIGKALESAGYQALAEPQSFIVTGKYGALRDGELEARPRMGRRARAPDGLSERPPVGEAAARGP